MAKRQTAAEAYQANRQDIAAMIGWLQDELDHHAERAAAEPRNYSFPGDLGEVRKRIIETLAFLSGHTVVNIEVTLAEAAE